MCATPRYPIAITSPQEARHGWQKSPAQGKKEAQESQSRQELRASCSHSRRPPASDGFGGVLPCRGIAPTRGWAPRISRTH